MDQRDRVGSIQRPGSLTLRNRVYLYRSLYRNRTDPYGMQTSLDACSWLVVYMVLSHTQSVVAHHSVMDMPHVLGTALYVLYSSSICSPWLAVLLKG